MRVGSIMGGMSGPKACRKRDGSDVLRQQDWPVGRADLANVSRSSPGDRRHGVPYGDQTGKLPATLSALFWSAAIDDNKHSQIMNINQSCRQLRLWRSKIQSELSTAGLLLLWSLRPALGLAGHRNPGFATAMFLGNLLRRNAVAR